ncbi:MAG: hypothetical protein WA431_06630 [Candidatus Cybelea sp.]
MFYDGIDDKGICSVGAGAFQASWRYCIRCHAMFYDGIPDKGKCPAPSKVFPPIEGHEASGFDFVLAHDIPARPTMQNSWRYCEKCHSMFWDGEADKGSCAAGGGHQSSGFNFFLPHDIPGTPSAQTSWRYCQKCRTMFYDGTADQGVCPAGGGHAAAGFDFVLFHDVAFTGHAAAGFNFVLPHDLTGMFMPGGEIAAAEQFPLQLDVFAINDSGELWVFFESGGGNWASAPMPNGNNLVPGAPLATATRQGPDEGMYFLDVRSVDPSGAIRTFSVENLGSWITGSRAPEAGGITINPGSSITDSTSVEGFGGVVLLVDAAGTLWQIFTQDLRVSDQVFAPAGADIAVASQIDHRQLYVFTVDTTGKLWVFQRPSRTYTGPVWSSSEMPGTAILLPGASLATAVQQSGNQVDVFGVDENGQMQIWWESNDGSWVNAPMPNGENLVPGSPLAMGVQRGNSQVDVFAVDNDGHMQIWFESDDGNWSKAPMINGGNLPPGAHIATGLSSSGVQYVFAIDNNGHIQVWWVSLDEKWNSGPMPGS